MSKSEDKRKTALKAEQEAKDQEVKKPVAKKQAMSSADRSKLNDKARFDYGILNAADMSEKQLKDEIAAIDKQATDAKKADAEK